MVETAQLARLAVGDNPHSSGTDASVPRYMGQRRRAQVGGARNLLSSSPFDSSRAVVPEIGGLDRSGFSAKQSQSVTSRMAS